MRKHEVYGMAVGSSMMFASFAALMISHHNAPWQHQESAQVSLNTYTNPPQPVEQEGNGTLTDTCWVVGGIGYVAVSIALVSIIDKLPERRRTITPVDIPLQQNSSETESIRVA